MPDLRQSCATDRSELSAQSADALVLFGAMGDLAHRKIFPALYHMVERDRLNNPVIGVAKAGRTDEHLKERARDSVQRHVKNIDRAVLSKLLELPVTLAATIRNPALSMA